MHRYLAAACGAFLFSLAVGFFFGGVWLLALLPIFTASLLIKRCGRVLFRCLLCGLLTALAAFTAFTLRTQQLQQMSGETLPFEGYVLERSAYSTRYSTVRACINGRWVILTLANYLAEEEAPAPGEAVAGQVLLTGTETESDTLLLSGGVALTGRLLAWEEPSSDAPALLCQAIRLRQAAIARLTSFSSDVDAALAVGMLTADLSELPPVVRTQFSTAGIAHILAVSGLHLSILVAVSSRLCDIFRLSRKVRTLLCLGCCIVMLVLAGFSVSVLRAVLMTGFLLLGGLLGRQSDGLTSLAAAAALLALGNPAVLTDLSFWLTCTATLGILLFARPLSRLLPRPKSRIVALLWECVTVSLAAQLGALPVTALIFGYLPTYSLLINVLILPLVYLVLCLTLLALALGGWMWLGNILFAGACFFAAPLRGLAAFFSSLPWATVSVHLWWQVLPPLLTLLLLLVICRVHGRRQRLGLTAAWCALLGAFLLITAPLADAVVFTIDEETGAVLVQQNDSAALLEATETQAQAGRISRLLMRCGSPKLTAIIHPAAFHDLTQELRLCRLFQPELLLCDAETALLGEDLLPEGTVVSPYNDTMSNILANITVSCPNRWMTLLDCGTQKVLKCWVGYDIITADDIPAEVDYVIDRAGNLWQRGSGGMLSRWGSTTAIVLY